MSNTILAGIALQSILNDEGYGRFETIDAVIIGTVILCVILLSWWAINE